MGFLVLWPLLYVAERQVLKSLDQNIRQNRQIFMDYVRGLPSHIIMPEPYGTSFGYCQENRVGGLWSYKICVEKRFKTNSCKSSPYFIVKYWSPTPLTFPLFNNYYLSGPFGNSAYYINNDKSICETFDLRGDMG